MSKSDKVQPSRAVVATHRHKYISALTLTWVKTNHPETLEKLRAIAIKKFPYSPPRKTSLEILVRDL